MPKGKENIPTLTSVLRRATAEVTGREVSGMMPSEKSGRSLPGARSMNLIDRKSVV